MTHRSEGILLFSLAGSGLIAFFVVAVLTRDPLLAFIAACVVSVIARFLWEVIQ
jgi:hypothetical protein